MDSSVTDAVSSVVHESCEAWSAEEVKWGTGVTTKAGGSAVEVSVGAADERFA